MIKLIILSGISGSGKSTAVNTFEDLGFYCIDNLPSKLINNFLELCSNTDKNINQIAIVIDIREGIFLKEAVDVITALKNKNDIKIETIFLDAKDEVIVKRYKETRRKHPLSENGDISKTISQERDKLSEIRLIADHLIDTTNLNVHQLKEIIKDTFDKNSSNGISLNFISFGYKHGFPYDADIVFDVRFLPNPYFNEKLKDLNGFNDKIIDYVINLEVSVNFINKTTDLLKYLIPHYIKEGKSYLTIGIGCTGGKHRSVVITNQISKNFLDLSPKVNHRDISKA